jgi:hypothetical protein
VVQTSPSSFRGSLKAFGFAYCDFQRRNARMDLARNDEAPAPRTAAAPHPAPAPQVAAPQVAASPQPAAAAESSAVALRPSRY